MNLRKILLVLVGILFLAGCGKKVDDNNEDKETLKQISEWVKTNVPSQTVNDVILPEAHPELGGTILWESIDEDVITSSGEISLTKGAKEATLGYSIFLGTETTSDFITIYVVKSTIDEVASEFANQFSILITRNYEVNTEVASGFEIKWTSSDESLFTNKGVYIKPLLDQPLTIEYDVTLGDETKHFTKEVTVKGASYSEKVEDLTNWLNDNYITSRVVDKEIQLPTRYEKLNIDINWRSGNVGVVSNEGVLKQYAFDRYVSLEASAMIDNSLAQIEFSLIVRAKEGLTKEEKLNSLLDAVGVPELENLTFTAYTNINQSYNFVPFYVNEKAPVTQQIIPLNSEREENAEGSRPGTKMTSVEYVTIHDTANNGSTAGAKTHAKILTNGFAASWHFAIDEEGAYQSIPLDEVAWHAGDGSTQFKLTNTGVVAKGEYPKITISANGYYEFNGVKSTVLAPRAYKKDSKTGVVLYDKLATTANITPSGLLTTIGEDGNYYIGSTYYNSDYAKISNGGGNRNSIGIETCVNTGSDYATTLRHTAKLVAEILIDNNIGVERVLQHNNFSGKDCPNAMRHVNYWNNFLDLVSLEKFAKEELADVSFVWSSLTPELLDNNGKIVKQIGAATAVSYNVLATYGETTVSKDYTINLK